MDIQITKEEQALLHKGYTPLSVSKEFNTPKEELIVTSYREGMSLSDIAKKANVSMGMVYTVLNNYKVPKRCNKTPLYNKIKHVVENKELVQELIKDYQFMNLKDIYAKYSIHKNGLYFILDLFKVERKSELKEKVLTGDIIVE